MVGSGEFSYDLLGSVIRQFVIMNSNTVQSNVPSFAAWLFFSKILHTPLAIVY